MTYCKYINKLMGERKTVVIISPKKKVKTVLLLTLGIAYASWFLGK